MMMNIIDLFSGAGGLTEGFRNDNFNIICHIEKNKDACETLKVREAYYYLKKVDKLCLYKNYLNGKISKKELLNKIPKEQINSVLNVEINEKSIDEILYHIDAKTDRVDGIIGGPPVKHILQLVEQLMRKKRIQMIESTYINII